MYIAVDTPRKLA